MAEPSSSTTPIGFMNKAQAYRVGAQVLARDLKGVGSWACDPVRYLYDHCIELSMKAALISTGCTARHQRSRAHRQTVRYASLISSFASSSAIVPA